jgi:hypothetical protein
MMTTATATKTEAGLRAKAAEVKMGGWVTEVVELLVEDERRPEVDEELPVEDERRPEVDEDERLPEVDEELRRPELDEVDEVEDVPEVDEIVEVDVEVWGH